MTESPIEFIKTDGFYHGIHPVNTYFIHTQRCGPILLTKYEKIVTIRALPDGQNSSFLSQLGDDRHRWIASLMLVHAEDEESS